MTNSLTLVSYDREDDLDDPGFGFEEQRETNRANSGPWGWYGASNSRGSASSRAYGTL